MSGSTNSAKSRGLREDATHDVVSGVATSTGTDANQATAKPSSGTFARPSNAVSSARGTSGWEASEPLQLDQLKTEIGKGAPPIRKQSDHTGRIYKALLILAMAVALTSLLPQANGASDTVIQSRPGTEPTVDAGSPDAPPPDVLIQTD